MNNPLMNKRAHLSSGFGKNDISRNKAPTDGSGTRTFAPIVTGKYDSWYPTEHAVWVSLCPTQNWTYEIYNKESRVVETQSTMYFAFEQHTVGATKRRFECSSGAHLTGKCYGCSERTRHYDKVREIEDATGSVPSELKNAPVSKMRQFALSVSLIEELGEFPKLDKQGQPVLTKKGKPIMTFLPMRLAAKLGRKAAPRAKVPGRRFHWSFGTKALEALGAENSRLETYCASCAHELYAVSAYCRACEMTNPVWSENYPDGMPSELLLDDKNTPYTCPFCDHEDTLEYNYSCTNEKCKSPAPGNLFAFELFLGSVSDTDHAPKIYKIRPRSDWSKIEGGEALINEPLELDKIYAPTPLTEQIKLFDPRRQKLLVDDAHLRSRDGGTQETFGGGEDGESGGPIDF